MSSTSKLGTPLKSSAPPPPPSSSTPPPPPPPVIPSTYFTPSEQRLFFTAIFGLIEISKLWDTFSPLLHLDITPTWSSSLKIQGPYSVIGWTIAEATMMWLVGMLRIPMLSPSYRQLAMLAGLSAVGNLACWLIVEPSAALFTINVVGPAALGGEWYWNWLYSIKRYSEPSHLEGVHKIRLLPYSTATLNPLSLSYCIPPDSPAPLHIPILFNNSIPDEVTYFVRSLETGHATLERVSGSQMKRSPTRPPRLRITDGEDDLEDGDVEEPETDPLSALILRSDPKAKNTNSLEMDIAKLPSVKPSDSLALIPRNLASSQNILFITVDKPSLITLKSVTDKRGDRFHITPHKEAIVIECPAGGQFIEEEKQNKIIFKGDKVKTPELRCVGEEETTKFQVRGVSPLKVGWKKRSGNKVDTGVIEGIEEDLEPVDDLALVRRDKVSKSHVVPLRVSHLQPGTFTLSLTSVTDALHNTYTPSGHSAEKAFQVIPRPSVRLDCPSTIQLLHNQQAKIPLQVVVDGNVERDLEVTYGFESLDGQKTTKKMKISKKREEITISESGIYTLMEVEGPCAGGVMEPSSCNVQMVPLPTMDMSVTTLHECAMDVGATAAFDFTGSPPFRLDYTEQRKGGRARTLTETFHTHHGSVVLRPEHEGEYTYTFTSLSDRRYKGVKLDKPPIKQTVHPLANVDMIGRIGDARKHTLFFCDGDQVDVDIEARGIAPLKLAYIKSWATRSDNVTVPITNGRSKISVPVPEELSAKSGANGRLTIALVSIEDGNGCVRKLNAPAIEVDIKRQKPTARFAKSQKVIITEGEVAKAPLRLTGEAPWDLTYSINGKERKITVRDPNNHLSFSDKGVYKLVKIKDAHCEGDISSSDSTFEIDFKPRPVVSLQQTPGITLSSPNAFKHKGLCAGQEQQVALKFTGQAPYELNYAYTSEGRVSKHKLKSAQETGILHLSSEPGYHRYDFSSIGDGNYPTTDVKISLEHSVYSRPSVGFVKHNTKPLCLDSKLDSSDAKIQLKGSAPFRLHLAVRKPASTEVKTYVIDDIREHEWKLSLPQHELTEIGRHEITITRLEDSSGCEQVINDEDELRSIVEVVESARIVAVDEKVDLCVGDSLDFLLQGKAPWTIEYEWLNKKHKVTSSAARFSRFAEEKGVFEVKSVALKDNQCKRQVEGMKRTVHALPKAKIVEGEDSLREGDEPAAFAVHFTGTAPFSFTYTRSEQYGSKSKVVETQTITDIHENTYTISSSLPGDYAVVAISDKFCRYPPISRSNKER
ncbi:hypothetical protein I302_102203 [Kwoniella bestiolae CBS 10118]|uniref:Nucleoporin POM152 n=1 Tax=Kwoniella bestiolae CBS 10118 TaxID=1296100 RepID=A0A1B9GEF0_9TREE|nr:hypothetical protein I302_00892 [Kwoniella bestiolae CBS 10118]OCF29388.1 hypothetical protein I302_00892 [Kwoniella bestiolae CBS 10118]